MQGGSFLPSLFLFGFARYESATQLFALKVCFHCNVSYDARISAY